MQDPLAVALELHRAGRLESAAQQYRKALALDAQNAEALHLLGVLHHQQGDHAKAIELIRSAVALRPNAAVFHANLAEAYRASGDCARAAGCCRTALQLAPDYADALCNLGAALQGLGQTAEAIECLRRALELQGDSPVTLNNLGIALRDLGQRDEALVHFRRAVELEPGFALARTNLGQLLLDRGEGEEALSHCAEAVRLQPDLAALHHNLGNALRALGKLIDAKSAYLEALRLQPKLAVAHDHMGLILQSEAQFVDALTWLKKAAELEPGNATFWEHLAELYGEMEEPTEAVPYWRHVLDLRPDYAQAHLALGWCLQEEGDLAKAAEHYLAAARLDPTHAGPKQSLGGLHEELGDMSAAEAAFREALRLQPAFALPHARLATLLRRKLPDDDLAALELRLADEQLAPGVGARLLFGLAHVLDVRGDFARAADCLRRANATTLELNKLRRGYEVEDHERFIDSLLGSFSPDFFARLSDHGADTRRPVFVFGMPRSGTTLIEQILASHSQIHGAGELRLARRTFEAIPAATGHSGMPRDCVQHLDGAAIGTLIEKHLAGLAAIDGGATPRIVDKMPDNYMYLGLLATLFPRATFIHARRELRDIAVSCWMTDFRSIRWANDQQHLASRFQQYDRVMEHWCAVLPVPIHEVDYQQSVSDLEGVARRLISACGLEWEPACLEFHKTERPIRTASVVQVREPVHKRSLARWKNYESDLGELFAAIVPESPLSSSSAASPSSLNNLPIDTVSSAPSSLSARHSVQPEHSSHAVE